MLLKISDISHPARSLDAHLEWSKRIQQEFFRQGDNERELGLTISPLCDSKAVSQRKSQMGFIQFVVRPLMKQFLQVVCDEVMLTVMNGNLDRNYEYWNDSSDSAGK